MLNPEEKLFTVIVLIVAIISTWTFYGLVTREENAEKCKNFGGIYVETPRGYKCIRAETIKGI